MRIKIETFYEIKQCNCGGLIRIPVDDAIQLSSPPQRRFYCDKCGEMYRLYEEEWPQIKYRTDSLEIVYKNRGFLLDEEVKKRKEN